MNYWRTDWNRFVRDVLGAKLDREQQAIITSVQFNRMTAVASGTARGKDYVSACAALCFMYLTPVFDKEGNMIANTKIALTAPTGHQIQEIMIPELSRLFGHAGFLPGRMIANGIRTDRKEWFLTGFKSDDNNTEAWSGFHAVNTMFVITEASGIAENIYSAIEGNLQGNSRLLLVFNPNRTTGYAAKAMTSDRFAKFRLSSLHAENVLRKQIIYPGQVDYDWVQDKVDNWCMPVQKEDINEGEGDFEWEGTYYRPNDLFRVKVLGLFPRVAQDVLIPYDWITLANKRWTEMKEQGFKPKKSCRLGVDVAGMGRDSSILCPRYGNYVEEFKVHQSAGKADHMHVAGMCQQFLKDKKAKAFVDTIGEGAGLFSRFEELNQKNVFSCKFSEGANGLKDITEQYEFANMRAYLFWAVRDWLNPKNGFGAALPPCDPLAEELTNIHWKFQSSGKIIIEEKDAVKKSIKRSPDWSDSLANTFYPYDYDFSNDAETYKMFLRR